MESDARLTGVQFKKAASYQPLFAKKISMQTVA